MLRTRRNESQVHRHPEAGFSLVEIMAAIVILTIALTAVFATFMSQQKSFTVQNRVAEMQQNMRQAVEYLSRDIRMAGYGIPDNVTIPASDNVISSTVSSIRSLYAKDSTTQSDQIYIIYRFDMDANQPPTSNSLGFSPGVGSITVASIYGFLPSGGELVIITDNTTVDLYETSGAAVNNLALGAGYAYNTGHSKSYPSSSSAVTVAKARFARYYIDNTTDPAHPTLMVNRMAGTGAQPVADDIEDMQIQYNMDTNGDGVVDTFNVNDPTTGNSATTGIALNLSQIRQVRLLLVARTRLPEAGWSETRPAIGNRAAGTTPDGYRRRVYDIVIDVRNSGV